MEMKKTKIVATISDKKSNVDFLKSLCEAGVNVIRLNTAHQTLDEALKLIQEIRSVSKKVAVLIDTKGPEIRTVGIDTPLQVTQHERVCMTGNLTLQRKRLIHVSFPDFVRELQIGTRVLIDDGEVELQVRDKMDDYLVLEVLNDGVIKNKKSV